MDDKERSGTPAEPSDHGRESPPAPPQNDPDPGRATIPHLISEFRRRRVFRVAAVYFVAGYAVIQAADVMFPHIAMPDWTVSLVIWLIILGFPIAVGLAWAFDMTSEGVERTKPLGGGSRAASALSRGLGFIATLLVLAALIAVWTIRRGPDVASEAAGSAPVTVAVLAASSPVENRVAEGMAGLLARGVDNTPGLRSAPENLVTRAWLDRDPGAADSTSALDVARSVNASAAVVLSSATVGTRLRLYARVYPVAESGPARGSVEVEGPDDDLIRLVDELAVDLVAELIPGESGESAAIASRSTHSLPAMRAFLLGEQEMRRSNYLAAIPHLRDAVQRDSTFALAWHRLNTAYGWVGNLDSAYAAGERAAQHSAGLPERERLIVDTYAAMSGGGRPGPVEDALRRRPDDWELAWLLSEAYLHGGWRAGISPRVADSIRARAAQLAPGNGDVLFHGVDLALGFYHDSSRAAPLIAEWESVAGRPALNYRIMMSLMFGDESRDRQADDLARLPDAEFTGFPYALAHPLSIRARAQVDQAIAGRDTYWDRMEPEFFTESARGRLAAALAALPDTSPIGRYATPTSAVCDAYMLELAGVDLAGTLAETWLTAPAAGGAATAEELLCRGGHAVDVGRWAEAENAVARLDALGAASPDSADPSTSRTTAASASALRTYLAWRRGDTGIEPIARSVRLELGTGESWPIRWWTGLMLREAGRREEALGVFESYWTPAWLPAFIERAEITAELGRTDAARDLYQVVLTSWSDADPQFQPLVERARAGLARLD